MSLGGRLSATGRRTVRERLVAEVGGYLRNVVREPHVTCAVCATPIKPAFDLGLRCWRDQREFGASLADLVVPVCYGIRGRQSGYLMHIYKDLEVPARHNQTLLSVLLLAALDVHGGCIEHRLGNEIDAWAFVPSVRTDRTGEHPLHVVAKRAGVALPEIELLTGERADPEQRVIRADRFALAANSQVRGRHVLLIEDTWTSGGNAQSAALTLRCGGAVSVTIVALARWLKMEEPPTGAFVMNRLTEDYDPLVCPVTDLDCNRSVADRLVADRLWRLPRPPLRWHPVRKADMRDLTGKTTGERIKHFRNRVGMSRPILGGLVGRSAEWVKAVETGRLQVPRLSMLLTIARAFGRA